MHLHPGVLIIGGLVIVILGAEFILRSSSYLAARLGISPMIIGLTIVSLGTSAPELAVGIAAVGEGRGGLAVGNIAGTNIVNILLILGLSAAIRALPLHLVSIRFDVPVMIGAALALFAMSWDGVLTPVEGGILLACGVLYTLGLIRINRRESQVTQKEFSEEFSEQAQVKKYGKGVTALQAVMLAGGITLTVLGAEVLVAGAVGAAAALGVSDAVIGLTIIAIGTSAPELVTTMVSTIKNERDVAIGNLIGSSILNIFVVLGITCMTAFEGGVALSRDVLLIDLPLAAAVAIACYPVFRSDRCVSRIEGTMFVSTYVLYVVTLIVFRT